MNERLIFLKALEMDTPARRAAYLAEACGDNTTLRQRIEALLASHERAGSFLDKPAPERLAERRSAPEPGEEPAGRERPGTVIGPYKLLQQIGEGGMGTVFMAEQQHPVRRKVALKVIKAGMDTKQVLARFEAERQALAMMDHLNIARVLDVGATDSGRPFFVMELVHGVPITTYCDDNQLTPRQRLELFVPVCHAIQHAHQKGIIHRDIKPSNILVTRYDGQPVPKVIDFGVAKATEQRLTERTLFTQYGTIVGTLEYMSPEQAELSGLGVDTRGDIYSLGVLLYELLTGSTPLERLRLREAAYGEVLRLIREEEAPRPSARLSSSDSLPAIAAARKTEPAKLARLVRGELDWIVLKALEKDRADRYETANGFAVDVQRYLADEPVEACPPSTWYRCRKCARRHKAALAFAACLLLMLSVLAGSLGWVARDRALRRSDLEREVTRAVADAQQLQEQSKWPEALAAAQRARGLSAGAELSAELARGIDDLESDLGMVLHLEEIHSQPQQPDFHTGEELDAAYSRAFRDYGIDIEVLEPGAAAERMRGRSIRQQLAMALDDWAGMRRRKPGDQSWKKLVEIARAADPDEWRERFRDAWLREDRQTLERLAESAPTQQLPPSALHLLGKALIEIGALDEGMTLLRDAQQRHPGDLWLNDLLAATSLWGFQPPRLDDALRYSTAALAVRPDNYRLHAMVGDVLRQKKSFSAALAAYARAIELRADKPSCWSGRGLVYVDLGQQEKAIADLSRAIELGPRHAATWNNRGAAYGFLGQVDRAIADYTTAIELDPKLPGAWNNRGFAYAYLGQQEKAIAEYSKAIELGPTDARPWYNRGTAHYYLGQADRAVADLSTAIELGPKSAAAWNIRGSAYRSLGQMDKALADYSQAIELDPRDSTSWNNRGATYTEVGQYDRGTADCSKAIELDPRSALAWNNRGILYRRQGQTDKAIADFSKAIELNSRIATAWRDRAECYQKLRQWDRALADFGKYFALAPNNASAHNNLAWLLATCPEQKYRDPGRAVELARKAVELAPQEGNTRNTLGVAYYRHGDWQPALEALNKSMELRKGGDANDWFFLAMAHWQLDQKALARKWYGQSVQWMDKNAPKDEELLRFRAEASELFGIDKKKD